MTKKITRFAPSPTGHLHIGGARTALYNYLLSAISGSYMILRIEDTDKERSNEKFTKEIINSLKWLGIEFHDTIYCQSQRTKIYQEYIEKLKTKGLVYKCYCSKEELDRKRANAMANKQSPRYDRTCRDLSTEQSQKGSDDFVWRFKAPLTGHIKFKDYIKGEVTYNIEEFDDFIIQRSDSSFTYNFAVVCDDIDLGITDLIRGDDHLNNTPKQIMIYNALEVTPPNFGHLPLILGTDGKRLSKRHGATSVTEYREQGFLPEALVNFLARIGWSHGDEEIFTKEDLIKKFSLDSCGKSAGIFNHEKLLWLNKQHLMKKSGAEINETLEKDFDCRLPKNETTNKLINLYKSRASTLTELKEKLTSYFTDTPKLDLTNTVFDENSFKELVTAIEKIQPFDNDNIAKSLKDFSEAKEIKLRKVAEIIRLSLSGEKAGPSLFELMEVIGKDQIIQKLKGNF